MNEIRIRSKRRFVRQALHDVKEAKKEIPLWAITQKTEMLHIERVLSGGLCSHCSHIRITKTNDGEVSLECAIGNNPVEIYKSTPYGQNAQCGDFEIAKREIK